MTHPFDKFDAHSATGAIPPASDAPVVADEPASPTDDAGKTETTDETPGE